MSRFLPARVRTNLLELIWINADRGQSAPVSCGLGGGSNAEMESHALDLEHWPDSRARSGPKIRSGVSRVPVRRFSGNDPLLSMHLHDDGPMQGVGERSDVRPQSLLQWCDGQRKQTASAASNLHAVSLCAGREGSISPKFEEPHVTDDGSAMYRHACVPAAASYVTADPIAASGACRPKVVSEHCCVEAREPDYAGDDPTTGPVRES